MPRDLTNMKFGRWTVLSRADDKVLSSGYHVIMWNCRCDCGNLGIVRGKSLTGGISKSCGCYQRELMGKRASKHGDAGTRLYAIWNSMRQRCNNTRSRAYANYGGRGIKICDEWNDYAVFRDWAMQSGYDPNAIRGEMTLDRIDVNGDYSPYNCKWSNMQEQARNRRESINLTYNGETHALTEWANIVHMDYTTLWKRYRQNLNPEAILKRK